MRRDTVEECIRLGSGETRLVEVGQGAVLAVQGAPVTLTGSPLWQGETLLRPCHRLRSGDAIRLERTGWILLSASGPADIRFHSPLPPSGADGSRWQAVLGWLRGAPVGRWVGQLHSGRSGS